MTGAGFHNLEATPAVQDPIVRTAFAVVEHIDGSVNAFPLDLEGLTVQTPPTPELVGRICAAVVEVTRQRLWAGIAERAVAQVQAALPPRPTTPQTPGEVVADALRRRTSGEVISEMNAASAQAKAQYGQHPSESPDDYAKRIADMLGSPRD